MSIPTQPSSVTAHSLSPELAFVDSKLGAAATELREVARYLRDRRRAPGLPPETVAFPVRRSPSIPAARAPRQGRRFASVALAASAAVVAAGVLGVVPAAGHRPQATSAGAVPSAASSKDRAALQAHLASTYLWSAVPGAQTYEVAVGRGGQVVYEATTEELQFVLPARLRLSPGRYTLTVIPDFGPASRRSAARPLVEATFLVAPS